MILSYVALAVLVVMIIVVVYVFIWIHDIPYTLAKKRNHPNQHAIHIACWLSLFTLHALWPFVFIWAIAKKPQFEVILVKGEGTPALPSGEPEPLELTDGAALHKAIAELNRRLDSLERQVS